MMRYFSLALAGLLMCGSVLAAENLKASRDSIEASYKTDLAVCMEFDKAEQPACKTEAQNQRKGAYQALWSKHDPKAPAPVYQGDLTAQKKQIEADYQLMQSVCKELDKASQSACKTEATSRKKASLKTAMNAPAKSAKPACVACGVVTEVKEVDQPGEGSWMGTVGGAAVGAGLGSLVGKGSGRTAAMILGGLGGAYAGNKIEGNMTGKKYYEVTVKLDDGTTQAITYEDPNHGFKAGDKVRVENQQLIKR
ncbi:glycine zipper 2TM domain-containing protein [Chitinibacter sp. S2-10]|uniref:glycine zipper 2TM domain-containing protein n=1 Tax=Chitinibacter sp. S2-10 TaxID=3373597 RepID=UPI0039777286